MRRLRRAAGRAARAVGLRRAPGIGSRPDPARPAPLEAFRLFAVVGTWFEDDVIEANVANAFAQGCDRVFVVDNASPDDTRERARTAGAEIALCYETQGYDEPERIRLMNEQVFRISREDGSDHIWWLWLDADEFPHGPGGLTLRAYLERLDRRFRVVGTRTFNHFPHAYPQYRAPFHPLDFQPLCKEYDAAAFGHCGRGHWKHPLQRFDAAGPALSSGVGFHAARLARGRLWEPEQPIFTHHFPYRDRAATRRRLDALCRNDAGGASRNRPHDERVGGVSGIRKRYESLDHVYEQNWREVVNLRTGALPEPFERLVPPADARVARWYTRGDLDAALDEKAPFEAAP